MTEAEARRWVEALDVPRGTIERLDRLAALVTAEQTHQNLVARSTLDALWARHIVDSLQLMTLAPPTGTWLDVGSGAGFPGLAVAAASERPVILAEPRAKRARFLGQAAAALGLADRATVHAGRVETLAAQPFAVVSARAVAALPDLFAMAARVADRRTVWLLPKGRSAAEELAAARQTWQGEMRLVPSLTDPQASIVVARDLSRRT